LGNTDLDALFDETYGTFELESQKWTLNEDGSYNFTIDLVPLHKCQEKDLNKFYPIKED